MRRWHSHLDAYTSERIDRCVAGLRRRFNVEQLRDFETNALLQRLANFQTAISTDDTVLIDAFHLASAGHEATLAIFEHQFAQKRRPTRGFIETQVASTLHELVMIDLPVDVGRVVIRPETLGGKSSPWAARRTVAVADQPVRRYSLLAEDDARARRGLSARFLQTVCEADRLVVEIDNSTLAAMKLRPMKEDDESELAPLAFALRRTWA